MQQRPDLGSDDYEKSTRQVVDLMCEQIEAPKGVQAREATANRATTHLQRVAYSQPSSEAALCSRAAGPEVWRPEDTCS